MEYISFKYCIFYIVNEAQRHVCFTTLLINYIRGQALYQPAEWCYSLYAICFAPTNGCTYNMNETSFYVNKRCKICLTQSQVQAYFSFKCTNINHLLFLCESFISRYQVLLWIFNFLIFTERNWPMMLCL